MNKYEKFDEQIIEMAKAGLRPADISKKLNIDSRRVIDRLKINNITDYNRGNSNKRIDIENDIQRQVLIGTILGDGCIFKGKGNKNCRMNLAHSLKQKEYFLYKYNILKSLGFQEPKIEKEIHSKNKQEYYCIKTQSLTNPLFTGLYNIWYKNEKKIIPKNHLKDITDLSIAIIYFDDGYYDSTFYIAMCNFDIESINNFRELLFNKYKIETTIQKNNILYIRTNSKIKFFNIINRYATSDVLYKLGELLETPESL